MIRLIENGIMKILTVFSLAPGIRLNRKSLQEKTGLNNIMLDKALNILLNFKILQKEKNLFSINHQNENAKKLITRAAESYNKLKQLPLKEYFMITDIIKELAEIKNIGEVYLFGSYSKLVFKESSDVDIAVISDSADKKRVNLVIHKLEKKYNKKIEIHQFSKGFYSNKKDPLVKDIIQNGVKLI